MRRIWTRPAGEGDGSAFGHTFGVRVDGPLARGFLRFVSLTALRPRGLWFALRAMSIISRLRRSRQHSVSILSAYLVHPFPLRGTSPQGETRSMERKNRESYISCTIPQFPPLVVNAVSQSPECVSCHMTQKVNPVTLTLCSSPHRAIPQPSARRAVKLKNPPAVRPVNPKNPFPQPFYTTRGASRAPSFPHEKKL